MYGMSLRYQYAVVIRGHGPKPYGMREQIWAGSKGVGMATKMP